MAVETRFVVMRNGAKVKTFMDKKAADEYDKMLDMADSLTKLLSDSPLKLNESQCEELSIFLAQQREEVLIALQAKKAKPVKSDIIKDEHSTAKDKTVPLKKAS